MNNKENSNTAATLAEPGTAPTYLTIAMLNNAPVRIKQADWPVVYKLEVPVMRLGNTSDITALPDLIIAEMSVIAGTPDPLECMYGPLGPELGPVSMQGILRLAVRKHRDGRVLTIGEKDNQVAICELLDSKTSDLVAQASRALKTMICLNSGHYIDEYENVAIKISSAAKRTEPAINLTGINSLDGDCVWICEDEWTLMAEHTYGITAELATVDLDERDEYGIPMQKRCTIAVKYLRIMQHKKNGDYLALGGYLFEHSGKIDLYAPLPRVDELAPKYAVVRHDVAGIAQGISDLGKKLSLPVGLVQGCLNALPAQDLR